MPDAVWEDPERVEEFAAKPPDHRLRSLLDAEPQPHRLRVLDLGCAAGRNAVLLAERGCEVHALDGSRAMVERTRGRLAAILGREVAAARVRLGSMNDLGWAAVGSFDLVVALGIYHNAQSDGEWERALAETARVTRPGGRLLVSSFTPETDLTGEGHSPVAGSSHLRERPDGRRLYLVSPRDLDAALARHGFEPLEPTTLGETRLEHGRRVSANGLYRRGRRAPVQS
jgi:SAM-dependent methyltransferase